MVALHISRLRQALLASVIEAGEALKKAFRADGASRVSQVVPSFVDGPRTQHDEAILPTTTAAPQSSSQVCLMASDLPAPRDVSEQGKTTASAVACDRPFEHAAPPRDGFAGSRSSRSSSRTFDSRLNESEGWFLTDMISGCEEGKLRAYRIRKCTNGSGSRSASNASSRSKDHGSMIMVSSVESLLSVDRNAEDVDGLSSGGSSKDEEDSGSMPAISGCGAHPSTGSMATGDIVLPHDAQQMEDHTATFLSELERQFKNETIFISDRSGVRLYMIDAGHGWSSYPSLEHLLHFLGEAVKVFGGDHLRGTKYLLPVDEAEVLVGELQKLAPSSWKDIASAAKAASPQILFAIAARLVLVELRAAAVAWVTEVGAVTVTTANGSAAAVGAAAATVGETASAATGAASLCTIGSAALAAAPWVILVGGIACGALCFIRELRNAEWKVSRFHTDETGHSKQKEDVPQGAFSDHCIVKWGQAAGQ